VRSATSRFSIMRLSVVSSKRDSTTWVQHCHCAFRCTCANLGIIVPWCGGGWPTAALAHWPLIDIEGG